MIIPLDLIQIAKARVSFWEFRKAVNPDMVVGWWQKEISKELEQFYYDMKAGKRPKLVVQSPPQHGKSSQIVDFLAWLSGKEPNTKTIYASYSERLGVRANLKLQRMYDSKTYKEIFPELKINTANVVTISNQTLRNREIIEYVGYQGFFRNTTVRGSVTGESLDLGVIDDPVKGRSEANSEVVRDSTWDWFTDDFFSRFADHAGLLIVLTRWHIDDIVGRMKDKFPDLKTVSYPAIAVEDEKYRKAGEALFPELKPLDFLLERKKLMPPSNWEALYQQNPTLTEGNMIQRGWIRMYSVHPHHYDEVIQSWDMTFKDSKGSDFVVGQVWGRLGSGFYLIDQVRDRMDFPTTIEAVRSLRARYPQTNAILVEAKANGQAVIDTLKSEIPGIIPIDPKESKEARLAAVSPLLMAGNVFLPEHMYWVHDFIEELVGFPFAKHDDIVDALSQALTFMKNNIGNFFGVGVINRR